MATLSAAQLYQINRQAGFDPAAAVIMTAIQLGESGGRSDALGDEDKTTAKWGPSVGISQVRSLRGELGTGGTRDAMRLTDPLFNARAAYSISSGGRTWTDWSVWNNRNNADYRKTWAANLAAAQAAAAGGGAGLPSGLTVGGVQPTVFGLPNPVAIVRKLSTEALFVAFGLGLLVLGAARLAQPARARANQLQEQIQGAVT